MANDGTIDDAALNRMSVAPGETETSSDKADTELDQALDDSMDASDPPAVTQPGHNDPAPSSGFDEKDEETSGS